MALENGVITVYHYSFPLLHFQFVPSTFEFLLQTIAVVCLVCTVVYTPELLKCNVRACARGIHSHHVTPQHSQQPKVMVALHTGPRGHNTGCQARVGPFYCSVDGI